jgi:phosphate transport system ATP-binding protein
MLELKGRFTIIIVTHTMARARRAWDGSIFMLRGRLVEHARTEDPFLNPKKPKTLVYIEGRYG